MSSYSLVSQSEQAMQRTQEMSSNQTTEGRILILEQDVAACAPYLKLAQVLDRVRPSSRLSEMMKCQPGGGPQIILLNAAGQPVQVLDRWRHLLTLDVPVMIVHAPDQTFVLEALRRGMHECMLAGTSPEIVALRLRRLLEREHDRAAAQQRERDLTLSGRMQTDFLRVISHDLKGQITNLRMAVHLLYDMAADSPDAPQILDNAELAISEIQKMIHTFLDATVQPGTIAPHIECVRAADAVQRALRQHLLTAARRQIALQSHCANLKVQADPQFLLHAISNLIGNAIKFTPDQGRVEVRATALNGQIVRISVIDTGPGIPVAERDRLFRPFARISTQPISAESSTGLGLWIVKYLTEMQHGTVGAHFPAEGGSVFYLDLPLCDSGV